MRPATRQRALRVDAPLRQFILDAGIALYHQAATATATAGAQEQDLDLDVIIVWRDAEAEAEAGARDTGTGTETETGHQIRAVLVQKLAADECSVLQCGTWFPETANGANDDRAAVVLLRCLVAQLSGLGREPAEYGNVDGSGALLVDGAGVEAPEAAFDYRGIRSAQREEEQDEASQGELGLHDLQHDAASGTAFDGHDLYSRQRDDAQDVASQSELGFHDLHAEQREDPLNQLDTHQEDGLIDLSESDEAGPFNPVPSTKNPLHEPEDPLCDPLMTLISGVLDPTLLHERGEVREGPEETQLPEPTDEEELVGPAKYAGVSAPGTKTTPKSSDEEELVVPAKYNGKSTRPALSEVSGPSTAQLIEELQTLQATFRAYKIRCNTADFARLPKVTAPFSARVEELSLANEGEEDVVRPSARSLSRVTLSSSGAFHVSDKARDTSMPDLRTPTGDAAAAVPSKSMMSLYAEFALYCGGEWKTGDANAESWLYSDAEFQPGIAYDYAAFIGAQATATDFNVAINDEDQPGQDQYVGEPLVVTDLDAATNNADQPQEQQSTEESQTATGGHLAWDLEDQFERNEYEAPPATYLNAAINDEDQPEPDQYAGEPLVATDLDGSGVAVLPGQDNQATEHEDQPGEQEAPEELPAAMDLTALAVIAILEKDDKAIGLEDQEGEEQQPAEERPAAPAVAALPEQDAQATDHEDQPENSQSTEELPAATDVDAANNHSDHSSGSESDSDEERPTATDLAVPISPAPPTVAEDLPTPDLEQHAYELVHDILHDSLIKPPARIPTLTQRVADEAFTQSFAAALLVEAREELARQIAAKEELARQIAKAAPATPTPGVGADGGKAKELKGDARDWTPDRRGNRPIILGKKRDGVKKEVKGGEGLSAGELVVGVLVIWAVVGVLAWVVLFTEAWEHGPAPLK